MICEGMCFRCGNCSYDCSCINNSCVKSTIVEGSHRMTIRNYISFIWYISCGVAYVLLIYVRRLWFLINSSYLFTYSLFIDAVNNSLLHGAVLRFKSCDSAVKLAFRMHPGQSEAYKHTYCGLMGCNTVLFGRWIPAFRRNQPLISRLENIGSLGQTATKSHPRSARPEYSAIRRPYLVW
jgi:hypothetical protein